MFKLNCLQFDQRPARGHHFHSTAFHNSIECICSWDAASTLLSQQLWKRFCGNFLLMKKIPLKFNNAVGGGCSRPDAIAHPPPRVLLLVATETSACPAGKRSPGHLCSPITNTCWATMSVQTWVFEAEVEKTNMLEKFPVVLWRDCRWIRNGACLWILVDGWRFSGSRQEASPSSPQTEASCDLE